MKYTMYTDVAFIGVPPYKFKDYLKWKENGFPIFYIIYENDDGDDFFILHLDDLKTFYKGDWHKEARAIVDEILKDL